jgi:hypothetical protein
MWLLLEALVVDMVLLLTLKVEAVELEVIDPACQVKVLAEELQLNRF